MLSSSIWEPFDFLPLEAFFLRDRGVTAGERSGESGSSFFFLPALGDAGGFGVATILS